MGSEGPSRAECIVEEAVKSSEAGEGIVDKIMGERHLEGDGGSEVVVSCYLD